MTPQASALNQGPWQRLEGRERALTVGRAVYVITGPLFERFMKPLPAGPELHRVPSGYWKIIARSDGRMSAFIMDQNTARNVDYCALRTYVMHVQLRSRLLFFPMQSAKSPGNLDRELGCATPAPALPPPNEIVTR